MRTYLTVAIPYVNAEPHVGYAYEIVAADIAARALRQRGEEVRFAGGTDDHALKNALAADAAGVPVEAFVDAHAERFADLRRPLDVSFDDFLRTSVDPRHRPAVARLWRACAANGDLYRKTYTGLYCVGCEQFCAVAELVPGADGARVCPEHRRPVEPVAETNWFFRLSRYQQHLERLIVGGRLTIRPQPFADEVLSFIRGGLDDISVSRPVERARGWGIPVPGDPTQVIYVWFDALASYLSGLRFGDPDSVDYRRWWLDADRRAHVIGKGILRFHAVYWPAFLAAADQPAPTDLVVHPYLTVDGAKISKTAASGPTAAGPFAVVDRYGTDAVRWWFARDVAPVVDTDFTEQRLVERANHDLANGIGNVARRITSLARRFRLPPDRAATPIDAVAGLDEDVLAALGGFDLRAATQAIIAAVDALNRELETTRPWQPTAGVDQLVGRYLASLEVIAAAVRPVVPALADRLARLLDGADGVVQPRVAVTAYDARDDGCGSGRHAACLPGPPGDLDAVAHAELALDVGDVALHGAQRDEQLLADLGVGQAAGDRSHDVLLALGQRDGGLPRRRLGR
jgi:methionyl-tRNA synthetase